MSVVINDDVLSQVSGGQSGDQCLYLVCEEYCYVAGGYVDVEGVWFDVIVCELTCVEFIAPCPN